MKKIKQYKKLLDIGTYESCGIDDEKLSRYYSFQFCLKYLSPIKIPEILELGTCRSFVDGKYEGCNMDDIRYWKRDNFEKWDWGAGCFSLVFGQEIPDANLTSVDIAVSHINRCKAMTDSLGIKCNHVMSDSIKFLELTEKKFNLIYLDTGDMTPIESTATIQLLEAKILVERNLLIQNGILLIDDVLNKTPRQMGDNSGLGKSKYSIPFLLSNGFSVVFKGYQYILKKDMK